MNEATREPGPRTPVAGGDQSDSDTLNATGSRGDHLHDVTRPAQPNHPPTEVPVPAGAVTSRVLRTLTLAPAVLPLGAGAPRPTCHTSCAVCHSSPRRGRVLLAASLRVFAHGPGRPGGCPSRMLRLLTPVAAGAAPSLFVRLRLTAFTLALAGSAFASRFAIRFVACRLLACLGELTGSFSAWWPAATGRFVRDQTRRVCHSSVTCAARRFLTPGWLLRAGRVRASTS